MRQVYGRHPVEALVDARPRDVKKLFVVGDSDLARRARAAGIAVESATKDRLEALARTPNHQGFVAEAADFPYGSLDDLVPADGAPALVLALDSIQDPHNLGALIRSAECFGATGVVFPQDRAALVTPTAGKASAGAIERLPVVKVVNLARALEELKERGLWVTGLAGEEGAEDLGRIDFSGPSAIVVGAEGEGLRPVIRKACDRVAAIPMTGRTGSLNASVAGGIALFAASAHRRRSVTKSA